MGRTIHKVNKVHLPILILIHDPFRTVRLPIIIGIFIQEVGQIITIIVGSALDVIGNAIVILVFGRPGDVDGSGGAAVG